MATVDATRRPPSRPPAAAPAEDPRWVKRAEQVRGMTALTAKAGRALVTRPFSWRGEFVAQALLLVRRCSIPAAISIFFFGYGPVGVQGANVTSALGALDRLGAVYSVAGVREFVPWISAMVVAGVAGTAVTADLGARKTREELDALAVQGVDVVRTLVAPRVLALALIMPAFLLIGVVVAGLSGLLATVQFGGTAGAFIATFQAGFTLVDVLAATVKAALFGVITGVVCSYKGINASGGPEGVGRAVNQAVVIVFVAVWVVNFVFNSTYQAAYPEAQNLL